MGRDDFKIKSGKTQIFGSKISKREEYDKIFFIFFFKFCIEKRWNFRRLIVASGASVCDRLAWLWVIWVSCQTRLTFCLEFQSRCGLWCYAVSTFDRLSKKIDYWIVADWEETRKNLSVVYMRYERVTSPNCRRRTKRN